MLSKMTMIHNHLTPEVLRRCIKSRLFGSERKHYKDKSMFDIAQLCFNDKFTEKVHNMYKLEQVNETSFYVLRHVDYYVTIDEHYVIVDYCYSTNFYLPIT